MVEKPMQNGRPDPDPTLLTTENLRREIANLKELIEARLAGNHELISSEIQVLTKVTEERFSGISIQFAERDKRTEQLSLADKTAIAAALQAQKEAAGAQNESNAASVTKQEAAFTKLLDQNQALFQTSMSALTTQINDLKSRLDTGEGQSKGKVDMWGWFAGALGLLIALAAILLRHN